MNLQEIKRVKKKVLCEFVNEFKADLGRQERLYWCQYYLSGLLLDSERKSIQAIAERLPCLYLTK